MNRDLDDLLDLTGRLVPGLSGQVAPAAGPGIRPGADNAQAIARLRDVWGQRYPEAGPHYLALRCWGPVSYTHLDVYKRQLRSRPPSSRSSASAKAWTPSR